MTDEPRTASGWVTVIVGETGRPRATRSSRGESTPAAGAEAPLQYSFRWEGGQPGPLATRYQGEPDLTLTISPPDAQLVSAGQLQLSVAFMQGRLKTAGDNALLLELLAFSTDRPLPAPVWGPPASRGGSA
jgi:hypothetical protein